MILVVATGVFYYGSAVFTAIFALDSYLRRNARRVSGEIEKNKNSQFNN